MGPRKFLCLYLLPLLPDAQIFCAFGKFFIGPRRFFSLRAESRFLRRFSNFAQILVSFSIVVKSILFTHENVLFGGSCAQLWCTVNTNWRQRPLVEAQPIDLLHVQCWLEQNFHSFSEMASLGTLIMLQNVTFDVHVNDKCIKIYVIFTQFTEKVPLRRFLCQSADFWRFGGRKL